MAPAMPLMNTNGTNTAMVVSDELSMGVIISVVPAAAARFSEYPRSRYCDTFSVTMMAVTKGHQDFPEYMLQINEVDVTSSKIYFSLEELEVDYEKTQKKPIEFKNTTFEDGK